MSREGKRMKPKCKLIGKDGNVFNLLGIVSRTLRDHRMNKEANECVDRVLNSAQSYDEALCIMMDYVEVY